MCLIIVADSARPSTAEIEDAHLTNSDGMGIAYREAGNPLVQYRKGLGLAELQALTQSVALPFVAHFRLATHGGITPALCHPFPITRNAGTRTEGEARSVLFHNGVWGEHDKFAKRARLRGAVSDTRVMAHVLAKQEHQVRGRVATQIAQTAGRLAIFTDAQITRYGEKWLAGGDTEDTTQGCYYSNDHHIWSIVPEFSGYDYSHLCYPTNTVKTQTLKPVSRWNQWWEQEKHASAPYVGRCYSCDTQMREADMAACPVDGQWVCEVCWDLFQAQTVRPSFPLLD